MYFDRVLYWSFHLLCVIYGKYDNKNMVYCDNFDDQIDALVIVLNKYLMCRNEIDKIAFQSALLSVSLQHLLNSPSRRDPDH